MLFAIKTEDGRTFPNRKRKPRFDLGLHPDIKRWIYRLLGIPYWVCPPKADCQLWFQHKRNKALKLLRLVKRAAK